MDPDRSTPPRAPGEKSVARRRAALLAKLVLAAGLVAWLLTSGRLDVRELGQLRERWRWLLLAQLPFAALLLLTAVRWHLLMRVRGIDYRFRETGALALIGWFFNQMVIGTTGGDLVKAWAIARDHPDSRSVGVVSIFFDRAMGLFMLVVVVCVAALVNLDLVRARPDLGSLVGILLGVLAGGLVGIAVFYSRRLRALPPARWLLARLPLRPLLRRIDAAAFAYRYHLPAVGLAAVASIAVHLLIVATNLCLARALIDDPLEWKRFLLLVPMAHAAMAIPVNPPGALGTAEAIYTYLFGVIGIAQGGLICVLQRLTFYAWALPGMLLYVGRRGRRRAPRLGDEVAGGGSESEELPAP
jgi:uncharacterized membrane protein YbhN (UPF0104 family)